TPELQICFVDTDSLGIPESFRDDIRVILSESFYDGTVYLVKHLVCVPTLVISVFSEVSVAVGKLVDQCHGCQVFDPDVQEPGTDADRSPEQLNLSPSLSRLINPQDVILDGEDRLLQVSARDSPQEPTCNLGGSRQSGSKFPVALGKIRVML